MTRIDKILAIKNQADIAHKIDLHACSDQDIDKLYNIVVQQSKGIPRSTEGYKIINQIADAQKRGKPVGKFIKN